ncbi:MAG TPA: hypothetical protein ENN67_06455 [Firmicutes bacterium]|nr:hypothetical protein [Bacillota bacterium]
MGNNMSWEIIVVGIVVLTAVIFAVRRQYMIISGKDKPCDSCPGTGPCPISSPDELEKRLRKALDSKKDTGNEKAE